MGDAWLSRLFFFHGRLTDFGDGPPIDHPGTTSSLETVEELLKIIPQLCKDTTMHNHAKRKIKSMACTYMSYIEEWENHRGHAKSNMDRVKAEHEWKLDLCYSAIMQLTDAQHSSRKLNNPWWAQRGYEFPEDDAENDDEWMDEYMY